MDGGWGKGIGVYYVNGSNKVCVEVVVSEVNYGSCLIYIARKIQNTALGNNYDSDRWRDSKPRLLERQF